MTVDPPTCDGELLAQLQAERRRYECECEITQAEARHNNALLAQAETIKARVTSAINELLGIERHNAERLQAGKQKTSQRSKADEQSHRSPMR